MPRTRKPAEPQRRRSPGQGQVYADRSRNRWIAAITVDSRLVRRTFGSEDEARAGLLALHAQLAAQTVDVSRQTLREYLVEWLADHVLVHRTKRTYEAYSGKLEKHVVPRLGNLRLQAVEPKHVRDLYTALLNEGTTTRHKVPKRVPLSPTTINHVHLILHTAFAWAVRDGRLASNPCDRVHVPQKATYDATTFDDEQVPVLLSAIRGHRYEPLWRYLLATGVRLGEATGCRVEDVDEARMSVRLHEAIAYVPTSLRTDQRVWWERKAPKSARSRRTTPLTLPALAAIKAGIVQAKALRLAAGKSWHDLGLVFPDVDGRPLREPKVLKAWDKMLNAAGLPKCRIHDLRHSFAGIALSHGAELLGVSRALGHANTAITDRVYAGRAFQDARRASDAVGNVLGEDGAETGS